MENCEFKGYMKGHCRRIEGCFLRQATEVEIGLARKGDLPDLPGGLKAFRNFLNSVSGCPEIKECIERADEAIKNLD